MKRFIKEEIIYSDDIPSNKLRDLDAGTEVELLSCNLDDKYDSGICVHFIYNNIEQTVCASVLVTSFEEVDFEL